MGHPHQPLTPELVAVAACSPIVPVPFQSSDPDSPSNFCSRRPKSLLFPHFRADGSHGGRLKTVSLAMGLFRKIMSCWPLFVYLSIYTTYFSITCTINKHSNLYMNSESDENINMY
jgi:hypothetical protein